MNVKRVFGNVDCDDIIHVSFLPCLVIRARSPSIRSGQKKRRGRPYSSTVQHDQAGNDPTLAIARHNRRAGQWLQYRTGAGLWIRQAGHPKKLFRAAARLCAVVTACAILHPKGSCRSLIGGSDPVKKRGTWVDAHLRVVTPALR